MMQEFPTYYGTITEDGHELVEDYVRRVELPLSPQWRLPLVFGISAVIFAACTLAYVVLEAVVFGRRKGR